MTTAALGAFIATLVLAWTPPGADSTAHAASAADQRSAQKLFDKGRTALGKKDFPTAIKHFEAAYALDPAPVLLGFLGRAYEEHGDALVREVDLLNARGAMLTARAHYEELAADTKAPASARARARERIPRLTKAIDNLDRMLKDEPEVEIVPELTLPEIKPLDKPAPLPPRVKPPPDLVVPGIITAAGGGVAAITGTILMFSASSDRESVTDATLDGNGHITTVTQAEANSIESDAATKATLGGILTGIGAAAMVGGVVMILISEPGPDPGTPSTTIEAAVGPDGAGVVLRGSF